MAAASAARRYTGVAIAFHWLIAIALAGLIAIGLAMTHADLAPLRRFQLYQWHKSVGITVLVLSVARLAWRLGHAPPPLAETMSRIERRAASATHGILYALLLGLPLAGWAVVSASPFDIPTLLYGTVPWPHLPILSDLADKAAAEASLKRVHAYGAYLMIALLLLHVAAALRHHLLLRDDTVWRMLPIVRRPPASS